MTTITALSAISHDGEDYTEGQTLDVSAKQAKSLIEAGAAKEGRQAAEAEVVKEEPQGDDLDELGFDDLKEVATAQGIEISELKSKDALRKAIRAKREAAEE